MIRLNTHAYCITGILKNGRRFKPLYTNTPQHYNIYGVALYGRLITKVKES